MTTTTPTAEFGRSEEQQELARVVRRFLQGASSEEEVRRLMETEAGYDPSVWERMATQLGLQSLAVPEEYGGAGFGPAEVAIVMEEMGAVLLCAPYLASAVMATQLLLATGDDDACREHLPGLADGSTIATVALLESSRSWDESGVQLAATQTADGWTLTGEKLHVLDGTVSDLFLVVARTAAGVSLFAVPAQAAGVTVRSVNTLDQTRKQTELHLDGTPGRLVGAEGAAWPAVRTMLHHAGIALAAEQVGGAQRVLDMAVGYAKQRIQFGRPIGSFQAIKHKCANLLLEVVSARSAAEYAAWAAGSGSDDVPVAASLAQAYCSAAYMHAAAENIQIHGGIGFTWEHPAHLYLKRAKTDELLFGDPVHHRALLADLVGV